MPRLIDLRKQWDASLRFRLWALGLTPLLIAFPVVIAVLWVIGGERANTLMHANIRGSLASAQSYLNQVSTATNRSIGQTVKSERLARLLRNRHSQAELDEMLRTTAQGAGLDYLVVADSEGRIIGSSTGVGPGTQLPDSYVIRQAKIGVASAAYERFDNRQLASFAPDFPQEARIDSTETTKAKSGDEAVETRGLLLNAAAHFPLAVNGVDAILVGGILLNQNFSLIEHLREILFPVGILPDGAEGMAAIYIDDVAVSISRQRQQGARPLGTRSPAEVVATVLERGMPWQGRIHLAGETFLAGYEVLQDGDGRRIGMLGVGFPDAPYMEAALLILGIVSGVLALGMMTISIVFLQAGREIAERLGSISQTMNRVAAGEKTARTPAPDRDDEIGQLTGHFNKLLDASDREEEIRSAAEAELEAYRQQLEQLVELRTRELNIRNDQLDAIFALSPDGFVSFDAAQRVSFINDAFLRMTNLSRDALMGLDGAEFSARLVGISLAGAAFPGIEALRNERKKVGAGETAHGTPNTVSRRHLFELAGPANKVLEVSLRLASSDSVSHVLYCRDVTHETVVDRMKSEFLSHAAHELRTPMASILGYAELLLAMEFSEEERREHLTTIHRQSQLLVAIINELLDIARIEARGGKDFVIEPLPLHAVIKDVIAGWSAPEGRDSPVIAGLHDDIWVRADRKKLMQALGNVVSNAYKYSPDGGDVTIRILRRKSENNERIGIAVIDAGIGMTPDQLARICERFYRADTSGKIPGSGLGMSIVKEIVELHGGHLEFESQAGVGTTITMWLPAAAIPTPVPTPA